MARLFVAVVPPDDVLDQIAELGRPEEPGVRYTTRGQWHVTLRFLGESEEAEAEAALEQVTGLPAEVTLGPEVRPLGRTVVVVPARGLAGVAAAVVEATRSVGEPPDPRPFDGHLTVARLEQRRACRILGRPFSDRFIADEVRLIRSRLGSDRAHYEPIATYELR